MKGEGRTDKPKPSPFFLLQLLLQKMNSPIFESSPSIHYGYLNSLAYATLVKASGDSKARFECLKPDVNSHFGVVEKRKHEYVLALTQAIALGADPADIKVPCSCGEFDPSCFASDEAVTEFLTDNGMAGIGTSQGGRSLVTLTQAATVAIDAGNSTAVSFHLATTGSGAHVMGAPSNMVQGGLYVFTVTRQATPTITWNAAFVFGSGSAPVFGADNAVVVIGLYSGGVLRCQDFTNFA